MTALTDEVNLFLQRLKGCQELSECKIIRMYPNTFACVKPRHTVIAVGLGEINAESNEIGGEDMYGSYRINANIFAPYGKNDIQKIIEAVVSSQLGAYPSSVSVSSPDTNDTLGCIVIKCSFTFLGNMNFGGDSNAGAN